MVVAASLPQIGTVIATAAVDSINPCAIGVLILLISTIIATAQSRRRMFELGMAYIGAVYVTYLLAGIGLSVFFSQIPIYLAEYISIVVGALIVLASLVEIKDYFWYGEGFSLAIDPEMAKKITDYSKNLTIKGMIFLGAFVAGVELPCTGAPYFAILLVLKQNFNLAAIGLLVFYNVIYVAPLLAILGLALAGMKATELKMWKDRNRPYMRLAMGVFMVFLGWLLIFIANGTVNFG